MKTIKPSACRFYISGFDVIVISLTPLAVVHGEDDSALRSAMHLFTNVSRNEPEGKTTIRRYQVASSD